MRAFRMACGVLIIGIFISLPLASFAYEEGVVHIGTATAMTGPWASIGSWQMRGASDRIDYQNDELGGIAGHRIEHLWADMKADVKTGIACYHRFKAASPKPVEISVGHSSVVEALKKTRMDDEILEIAWNANVPQIVPPGWIYWVMPGYADCHVAFGRWLKENWNYSAKGIPRVACIGREHPRTYSEWDGYKYSEDNKWLERVGLEVYPFGVTDVRAEMKRIAEKKPDFLISLQAQPTFGIVMEEAKRLGMLEYCKIVVGVYDLGKDYMVLPGELAKGTLGISIFATATETNLAGVQLIRKVHEKYHGNSQIDDDMSYVFGWLISDVTIEATKRAINKVGYKNMTNKDVKEALESIKDYDTGGLTHPLSYGAGTEGRRGNKYARIVSWDGGKWSPVSPWYEVPFIEGAK
jgi:branched-chain amino acid transport system substrate-binding protein